MAWHFEIESKSQHATVTSVQSQRLAANRLIHLPMNALLLGRQRLPRKPARA